MSIRPVKSTIDAKATTEGAGVELHRAFGFHAPREHDPFLLFDDFRGDHPQQYQAGFPWHPHRGIETITYVLAGNVKHEDSLGNTGNLTDGDLQLMTAGSGIMHQEMPSGNKRGQMHGFQLWANLPSSLKMSSPRYQDVPSKEMPFLEEDNGTKIKVLMGNYKGIFSPVEDIAAEPQYLDIFVPAHTTQRIKIDMYRNVFAYIFEGSGHFHSASNPVGVKVEKEYRGEELTFRDMSGNRTLVNFDTGEEVVVTAGAQGIRFLLCSGRPIEEPVAWYGPIVMNTSEELKQAIDDLKTNNFIKEGAQFG